MTAFAPTRSGWTAGHTQKVHPGQYVVFDHASGHYTVDARVDWTGSEEVGVDVFVGAVVHLRVEPAGSVLSQLWQAFTLAATAADSRRATDGKPAGAGLIARHAASSSSHKETRP